MAEQHLEIVEMPTAFQEMDGEGVAKVVDAN
jgi:hypothetical protein